SGEHESKIGLLLDDGENREVRLGIVEEVSGEHESKIGLLLDGAENREVRLSALEEGREAKEQEMRALQDAVNAMSVKLEQLSGQIPVLRAAIVEKDEEIALLEKRPTIEQIMDARATASLYKIDDVDGGMVTLKLRIEHSEDLARWTPVDDVITHTLPIPDGKRFYRFALVR
ncbi:MAG: coiled-coil domain-containing protein 22, partial [Verrucomicrobiaceae bacterium]|nr:coiled-coil domain-containing protein 22 [Verrucomicrobiaceae bacterium]